MKNPKITIGINTNIKLFENKPSYTLISLFSKALSIFSLTNLIFSSVSKLLISSSLKFLFLASLIIEFLIYSSSTSGCCHE